ncbi:MAG: TetR/AcrR family transcriptional regulator [Rubrobacteraceae bacterium]|nr:TetR/AcrR family transcriptional regulator [Rubrobacter sp.]
MDRAEITNVEGRWNLDHLGHGTSPGPERKDAVRNRRAIVEAARTLFDERGVTRVTMEQVAKAAGVGKGTLYRRFPNKGLLCQALLDTPTRTFQEETMRLLGESGMGPLDKLDVFLDRLVWFTEENLDLLYGGNEPLCGADRISRYAHPAFDWRRWTVLSLLREAERTGELGDDLDLEYVAAALLTPLDLDFYYYQRRVKELPVERISAGLRSLAPGVQTD